VPDLAPVPRLGRARDWPFAIAAMGLALGFAALAIRLWQADLSVPLRPGNDATQVLMLAKAIIDHGWYLHIPELGAPYGLSLSDFPAAAGDSISMLLFRFFALFTTNPAVVVNLYFLAGFPLVAGSAFLVLRRLGVSRPTGTVVAALYALLPPHFLRGEMHLFLGAYVSAPIGCYLILRTLGDEPIFVRARSRSRARSPASSWLSPRNLRPLGLCVLIGALGTDYAIFTIVLLILCSAIGVAWSRRPRRLVSPTVLCVAIAATLGLQYLPTVIYHASHGPNPVVGKRYPFESENYGLKLGALILPQPEDRIAPLAAIGKAYATQEDDLGPPNEDSYDTLGLIGAIGFLGLLAFGIGAIVRRGPPSGPPSVAHRAALATLVAVLAGVAGGFPIVFAIFVTPDVRAWNRIAVFIGFFALLAVALVLDRVRSRLAGDPRRRLIASGILAAVLLFGVYDQTNNGPAFVPPYSQYVASAHSTSALVAGIERELPRGASVWQLPYTGFPETPPHAAELSYDQLVPYLYSHGLHWSAAALLGRPTDWQARLTKVPLASELPGVSAAGFDGVLVDRRAYKDAGVAVVAELTRLVGPPSITSADRRYAFFDLRSYGRALLARIGPEKLEALARATVGPGAPT